MTILYHNRTARTDLPYAYLPSLEALAEASDVLVVSCPGGPSTRGIVNQNVLAALGPSGFLVNVGRGSVVDNTALAEALHARIIAGAGLDVLDGEPTVPERLLSAPNLIFSPHVGGSSIESKRLSVELVLHNLSAHFAGQLVAHRVA